MTSLDSRHQGLDANSIAGTTFGAVAAVAAVLALFKGWKIWKERRNTESENLSAMESGTRKLGRTATTRYKINDYSSNTPRIYYTASFSFQIHTHPEYTDNINFTDGRGMSNY